MAKDDEDGVQDQGSLDEPLKSVTKETKNSHPDVGDWDPDNPTERTHDVSLKQGEPVDPEALNRDSRSKKDKD